MSKETLVAKFEVFCISVLEDSCLMEFYAASQDESVSMF